MSGRIPRDGRGFREVGTLERGISLWKGALLTKDAAQVLSMAEEFDVVERLQTALGVGGFSVARSSAVG
jgi:hypothetical protein